MSSIALSPAAVEQIERAMRHVLTTVANAAAVCSGWQRRQRTLTGASFVQTLVFASWQTPTLTCSALARMAGIVGTPVAAPGLLKRCTPAGAELLRQVVGVALEQVLTSEPRCLPLLQRFRGVYVLDSTVIALPDATQSFWQGCGGSGSNAALKLQTSWDLCGGQVQIELVDGRTHDAATAQQQHIWPAGSLRLADLGYLSREVLHTLTQAGVTVISRVKVGTRLTTPTGARLDLLGRLRQQPARVCVMDAQVYGVACRLIAIPATEEAAERRRAVLRNTARKAQRTVSQAQWEWAGWTILFTTDTTLSVSEILVLYRMRWQIEVVFHRWKEVIQVDTVRSQQPWRVLCEVLAKLLVVILTHWLTLITTWPLPAASFYLTLVTLRGFAIPVALDVRFGRSLWATLVACSEAMQYGCSLQHRRTHPAAFQLLQQPGLIRLS